VSEVAPLAALAGGALIGLAGALLLLAHGRIAGITGIFAGMLAPRPGDVSWRALFIAGLVAAGAVASFVAPEAARMTLDCSVVVLAVAGILVGFGARLGGGCTSGHGVCGIGRFSWRSMVATLTFILTGALTAFVAIHVLGAGN
jgi:uncharacterized membrane protein YedE/YeeE